MNNITCPFVLKHTRYGRSEIRLKYLNHDVSPLQDLKHNQKTLCSGKQIFQYEGEARNNLFSSSWHFCEPVLPPLLPISRTLDIHLSKLFHLYPWPVLSLWPMNPHQTLSRWLTRRIKRVYSYIAQVVAECREDESKNTCTKTGTHSSSQLFCVYCSESSWLDSWLMRFQSQRKCAFLSKWKIINKCGQKSENWANRVS